MYRCEKCLTEFSKQFDVCPMCGGKIIEFTPVDPVAEAKKKAEEDASQRLFKLRKLAEEELDRVKDEIFKGRNIYLYRSIYMSVDSDLTANGKQFEFNAFSDRDVIRAGLHGWKVVSVVPRTTGRTLENYEGFSKVWAGGIGGNIVGAYVLMEIMVDQSNFDYCKPFIANNINAYVA